MIATVLGSGTLLPNEHRHSPAHWVEAGEARILLDCGAGSVHGFDRYRIPWKRVTHLAVSHFHTDHVGDVAALLFALKHGVRPPREEPLTLLGPAGLRAFLDHLAAAHGAFVTDPGFPVEVVELEVAVRWEDAEGAFTLAAHPTPHTDASLAYRLETDEGALGYTGDTGPSDEVADFLAGVPLLIAECSVPDPPSMTTHLSPATLAGLARRASPGLLVVTHFYPPLRAHRIPAQLKEAGYAGEVVVAQDGTRIEVLRGKARLVEG